MKVDETRKGASQAQKWDINARQGGQGEHSEFMRSFVDYLEKRFLRVQAFSCEING
jgi:hypothetical protein